MPPKFKFTKEEITESALGLVREEGMAELTARRLADRLGSSPKPIFGLFSGMDELKEKVIERANSIYNEYIATAMNSPDIPPYKASGLGYIKFAKEEKELFKLLFMRDRSGESIIEDRGAFAPYMKIIMDKAGCGKDDAYIFHLEMWLYVHGIATMIATSYLDWNMEFVSSALSDMYWGMMARLSKRSKNGGN